MASNPEFFTQTKVKKKKKFSSEKNEQIRKILQLGRERGYLFIEEINGLLEEGLETDKEFDGFIESLDRYKIKIRNKQREIKQRPKKPEKTRVRGIERTTDPVKLYLREMGSISLLTKEGEIALARQIERSERNTIKALSRTPFLFELICDVKDRYELHKRILNNMFDFDESSVSGEHQDAREERIFDIISQIKEGYSKLEQIPKSDKNRIKRLRILSRINQLLRSLRIKPEIIERATENLHLKLEGVNRLEEIKEDLEAKYKRKRKRKKKLAIRKQIKDTEGLIHVMQEEVGIDFDGLKKIMRTIRATRPKKNWLRQI